MQIGFDHYELMRKSFEDKVLRVVSRIPRGRTMSYKQVAELAGSPKAYRAVGNILNSNYDPKIPCHRVIRSDGRLGGYNRGKNRKMQILVKEGVSIKSARLQ